VRSGAHDELGASPYLVVRDRAGVEHYARLGMGQAAPAVGKGVELIGNGRGQATLVQERGLGDRGI